MFSLPEGTKIIEAIPPSVGAGAVFTGDYISVKNYHRVYIVVHYSSADGVAETWAPHRATSVAGTGDAVLVNAVRIWANFDTATSDTLVEQAAAVNCDNDNTVTNQILVFEIDPADIGAYDCITIVSTAIAAGNYVSAMYYCVPRYPGRVSTQPSGIID